MAEILNNLNQATTAIASNTSGPNDSRRIWTRDYAWVENTTAAEEGMARSPWVEHSYSGADIVASMLVPGERYALHLGDLQTISWSTHRENTPVRGLGHTSPCGFVRGSRTISGSLIFTQFNKYTFYRLEYYRRLASVGLYGLGDMLPPFDILISATNEYGSFSKMKIYGVTIVDEGGTMSIDDMVTENTMTYMARGIQPLIDYVPYGFELSPVYNKVTYNPSAVDRLSINS